MILQQYRVNEIGSWINMFELNCSLRNIKITVTVQNKYLYLFVIACEGQGFGSL